MKIPFLSQTREQVARCPKGHLTPGLVSQPLNEEQAAQLDQINAELTKEYSVRREMLLTRCDVTVQSFKWSDRVKVWPRSLLWLHPFLQC